MVLRPTEILPQCNIGEATAGSGTGRGELLVAIDDLVARVRKLAVQVNRIATPADTAKVTSGAKGSDRLAVVAGTDLARDLPAGGTAKAENFPLSPHQDSSISNIDPKKIGDEVDSSIEASQFDRRDSRSRAKNAIAGRVLDLHDRLGGFIKPLPLDLFDQER